VIAEVDRRRCTLLLLYLCIYTLRYYMFYRYMRIHPWLFASEVQAAKMSHVAGTGTYFLAVCTHERECASSRSGIIHPGTYTHTHTHTHDNHIIHTYMLY
jgi:hypothetical protein